MTCPSLKEQYLSGELPDSDVFTLDDNFQKSIRHKNIEQKFLNAKIIRVTTSDMIRYVYNRYLSAKVIWFDMPITPNQFEDLEYRSGADSVEEFYISSDNPYYEVVDGIIYTKDRKKLVLCPQGKTSVSFLKETEIIGEAAFYGCNKLTELIIPGNISYIGTKACACMSSLSSVVIEPGLTHLGGMYSSGVFASCDNLQRVILPDGLTMIWDKAFAYCRKLSQVKLPASLQFIGQSAFAGTGIDSLTLPSSIIEVDKQAFYGIPQIHLNSQRQIPKGLMYAIAGQTPDHPVVKVTDSHFDVSFYLPAEIEWEDTLYKLSNFWDAGFLHAYGMYDIFFSDMQQRDVKKRTLAEMAIKYTASLADQSKMKLFWQDNAEDFFALYANNYQSKDQQLLIILISLDVITAAQLQAFFALSDEKLDPVISAYIMDEIRKKRSSEQNLLQV